MIKWEEKRFEELSADELYEIFKIRAEIFVLHTSKQQWYYLVPWYLLLLTFTIHTNTRDDFYEV